MNCALYLYMCGYSTPWKLYFFSRNINLTSRRLNFRTALTFFEYLVLIKITLGVHLLLGIDSVIKNLFKVLNTYKKRSVHLPLNSKRYKEFNLLHILLFSIFRWASWPTNSARLAISDERGSIINNNLQLLQTLMQYHPPSRTNGELIYLETLPRK